MIKASTYGADRWHTHSRSLISCLLAVVLAACQNAAAPAPTSPPLQTPVAFTPLDSLLPSGAAPSSGEVTTAGYLMVDSTGAALVDGLGFATDGTPQLIGGARRLWLGTGLDTHVKAQMRSSGGLLFAPARVRGRLEGPGAYGPSGSYEYQMQSPVIAIIAAQETTIGDLLDHSYGYENQLVRLVGSLLARDGSALLVDQLGAGGLPLPKSRQIKLRGPIRDRVLLGQLKGAAGGSIRFGQVQVEGFWRAGALIPLSIALVRNG